MSKRKAEELVGGQETTEEEDKDNRTQKFIAQLNFSKPTSNLNCLERGQCKRCDKARRYYCYSCMIPMGDANSVPKLQLPMQVIM
jgi:hypothetical protein